MVGVANGSFHLQVTVILCVQTADIQANIF